VSTDLDGEKYRCAVIFWEARFWQSFVLLFPLFQETKQFYQDYQVFLSIMTSGTLLAFNSAIVFIS